MCICARACELSICEHRRAHMRACVCVREKVKTGVGTLGIGCCLRDGPDDGGREERPVGRLLDVKANERRLAVDGR
eukprot:1350544-Pleurochrysis_carterae.AAC.1